MAEHWQHTHAGRWGFTLALCVTPQSTPEYTRFALKMAEMLANIAWVHSGALVGVCLIQGCNYNLNQGRHGIYSVTPIKNRNR